MPPPARELATMLFSQHLDVRGFGRLVFSNQIVVLEYAEAMLGSELCVRAQALATFAGDLDILVPPAYRVFAKNLDTDIEIELGFLPLEGTLTLQNIVLPDGNYLIEPRAEGAYWYDCRFGKSYPIQVVGGEIVDALPTVTGLCYEVSSSSLDGVEHSGREVKSFWRWDAEDAKSTPEDFAIWLSDVGVSDTSDNPDVVVTAHGAGGYMVLLGELEAAVVVAVAPRRGTRMGPIATLTIPEQMPKLESPENQKAKAVMADSNSSKL